MLKQMKSMLGPPWPEAFADEQDAVETCGTLHLTSVPGLALLAETKNSWARPRRSHQESVSSADSRVTLPFCL
jgi:hypothetical protein